MPSTSTVAMPSLFAVDSRAGEARCDDGRGAGKDVGLLLGCARGVRVVAARGEVGLCSSMV